MSGVIQSVEQFSADARGTTDRSYTVQVAIILGAIVLLISSVLIVMAVSSAQSKQVRSEAVKSSTPQVQQSSIATAHTSSLSAQVNQSTVQSSDVASTTPITSASVQVNGHNIPLPSSGNGAVHQTIDSSDGGKTTVDMNVSSSSSSDSSTLNLNVSSQSSVNNSE